MSNPKPRRRILLPTILATGLAAAGGGGGYWIYASPGKKLSAETQSDLEAGFESAQADDTQGNDTLGALASKWSQELSTPTPTPNAPDTPPEDVEPSRALPSTDRYATPPVDVAAGLPPLPEPAVPGDRYAESPVSDEPHSAEVPIARGQSPAVESPTMEALPDDNPLRSIEPGPFGDAAPLPVADNTAAERAFAESAALPVAATDNYREAVAPEPAGVPQGNPLRTAAVAALPAAATAASQAAPVAEAIPGPTPAPARHTFEQDQYNNRFAEAPLDSQAVADAAPFAAAAPMVAEDAEIAQQAIASTPPSAFSAPEQSPPVEPASDYNAFAPTPVEEPMGVAIDEGTGRPGERALEGPQRPSLVLQKFAPEEIQVGKECKFVIKIRNTGQRPADNVVVEDEVPQGARFVAASPQPESTGGTLRWQLGTLSPGEERTMEVELMPTEEGEIGSVAKVIFASHASAKSRCTRPQLALRMSAPGEVLIGRQQRLTIELHNPGTGDATGVMLLENVPENVRHQAGPALEFEVGTLRAGETRRMELVLTAEKPGRVVNVLTARADGNLQVQQEVEFEVISPALTVGVDGPARRYLERPATYTVSVDNPGTAPAKDVQLVTKLPKGMRFVRANNLGEYDSATHSVYWSLAELPEGQNGTVELVALPVQSGDHTIEVEGRAREGLEDRTTQPVRIEGLAAIMFTVADAQDPIEVGGATSYEVRVVNQGSKAATNVQVTALVPPGMTVTNAQGETRHSVEAEGVVFEPIGRLAPKADSVFRVDVQGVQPGDQRMMVEVRTDDLGQPIRKEESTRVFGDE